MNYFKLLAILFALITLGAIQETLRILTSTETDIANNRIPLLLMAIVMTAGIIWATFFFWRKGSKKK